MHRFGGPSSNTKGHTLQVNAVHFSADGNTLYSAGDDKQLIAWDLGTGTVARSTSTKKHRVTSLVCDRAGDYLYTASSAIHRWDTSSLQIVKKFEGHASQIAILTLSHDNKYLLSADTGRFINLWHVADSSETNKPLLVCALDSTPVSLSFGAPQDSKYSFAGASRLGSAAVWQWDAENDMKIDSDSKSNNAPVCVVSVSKSSRKSKSKKNKRASKMLSLPIFALHMSQAEQLNVARGAPIAPKFHELSLFDAEKSALKSAILLPSEIGANVVEASGPVSRKRKSAHIVTVGNDSIAIPSASKQDWEDRRQAKQARLDGDADAKGVASATMADRVNDLQRMEQDTVTAGRTGSSAGTFQYVLSQALQNNDKQKLETVLTTASEAAIRNTVGRLPTADVLPLLQIVIAKFKTKPTRGPGLSVWIQHILSRHTGYLLSVPNLSAKLGPLYRVIEHRLASFKKLLKLSGRLELLLSQINRNTEANSSSNSGPINVYEENDAGALKAPGTEEIDNDDDDSDSNSDSEEDDFVDAHMDSDNEPSDSDSEPESDSE
jgi:U3 small nucleolar RNA-associated protein 5